MNVPKWLLGGLLGVLLLSFAPLSPTVMHYTAEAQGLFVRQATGTPILANGLTNSAVTVTSGAGLWDSYFCYNPNSSVAYVQVFDISGAVSLGSSTPKWSIGIPATSAGNMGQMALNFANAIKVAATTTATGSTAPSTALDCNFSYR